MADDENAFAEALREQPFDSQVRWYDQYRMVVRQANDLLIEHVKHLQRIHALEQQLQSLTLAESDLGEVGTPELQRIAVEHLHLVRAIVADLRARHDAVPDELRGLATMAP